MRDLRNLPDEARLAPVDAAELLGISRPTFWRWVKLGRVPAPAPVLEGARPTVPAGAIRALLNRATDRDQEPAR